MGGEVGVVELPNELKLDWEGWIFLLDDLGVVYKEDRFVSDALRHSKAW